MAEQFKDICPRCLEAFPVSGDACVGGSFCPKCEQFSAYAPPKEAAKPEPQWSMATVAALNTAQTSGRIHPYTCPNRGNHPEFWGDAGVLVATIRGWICPCCDYTQSWAHGVTEYVDALKEQQK